jgi:translocation and assembly module TamA
VKEDYARKKIPWKEGELFDADLVKKANSELVKTGLFTMVRVSTGESVDENGFLPMMVEVKERKPRTVKIGAKYGTDEGPGGSLSWKHRNLFGRGEHIEVQASASGIGFDGEGTFGKPYFLRDDQTLFVKTRLAEDKPDGYTSRNFTNSLFVERTLREKMALGLGPAYKVSRVEQSGETNNFSLLSLPSYFSWDTSNDLLDPIRGGRLNVRLAPFQDLRNSGLRFFKGYVSYSRYLKVAESPFLVLAARGALGSITGASFDDVPADERFYAGGGGSIRGYAFQSVGLLDEDDDPLGGRSLLELSFEMRFKITQTIGLVAFMDGGSAFESEFPSSDETIRWGTGLGFRYFTPVGPLRADVGIPLNRRSGIDDAFQFYISIGQAF